MSFGHKLLDLILSPGRVAALAIAVALVPGIGVSKPQAAPICPSDGRAPSPAYSAAGQQPKVATWHNIGPLGATGCGDLLDGKTKLAIVLAGRFEFAGSTTDLAKRVGAVSLTKGLRYWSVTDRDWRVLLEDAYASRTADGKSRRRDFSAAEVLSGRKLYLAQDDTRSTGINAYSFRTIASGPDGFAFEMVNLTAIGIGPITFFPPGALKTLHFFSHEGGAIWTYYGLSVVKRGNFAGQADSYINRNAAFFRFVSGQKPDGAPPLAR